MITRVFNAIDDQEHSGRAVDAAIEIANATSSTLIFFVANPAVLPGRGPTVYLWTEEYIREYFTQARARARQAGLYDITCITKNVLDIAKSILVEAENAAADYIVLGSNCRPSALSSWRHSITRAVVAQAHCPTLIVHSVQQRRFGVSRLLAAE